MELSTTAGLARAAEVSVPAVSRTLSGSVNVRPATTQRVRNAAEQIGFNGLGAIGAWPDRGFHRQPPIPMSRQRGRELPLRPPREGQPRDRGGHPPPARADLEPARPD